MSRPKTTSLNKRPDEEAKPRPQLIKTDSGWKVTDGWIGSSYFRIIKQPSEKTIKKLHEFFYEVGMEILNNKERKAV